MNLVQRVTLPPQWLSVGRCYEEMAAGASARGETPPQALQSPRVRGLAGRVLLRSAQPQSWRTSMKTPWLTLFVLLAAACGVETGEATDALRRSRIPTVTSPSTASAVVGAAFT